jgi:hypothetical protein
LQITQERGRTYHYSSFVQKIPNNPDVYTPISPNLVTIIVTFAAAAKAVKARVGYVHSKIQPAP